MSNRSTICLFVSLLLIAGIFSCKTAQRTSAGQETMVVASAEYKVNMSPQAKKLLKDLESEDLTRQPFVPSAGLLDKYGFSQSGNDYFVRGMIKVKDDFDKKTLEKAGVIFSPPAGNVIPLSVPVQHIPFLLQQEGIEYFEMSGVPRPAR